MAKVRKIKARFPKCKNLDFSKRKTRRAKLVHIGYKQLLTFNVSTTEKSQIAVQPCKCQKQEYGGYD